MCVACFRAGDHEGHDYIMYRSETGGACDCGDLESWARAGCCPAHAPKTTNPAGEDDDAAATRLSASSMTRLSASSASTCAPGSPSRLVRASRQRAFLGVVVERLVLALECVARTRGPRAPVAAGARRAEEERVAERLLEWLSREADAGDLRVACAEALSREWLPPKEKGKAAARDEGKATKDPAAEDPEPAAGREGEGSNGSNAASEEERRAKRTRTLEDGGGGGARTSRGSREAEGVVLGGSRDFPHAARYGDSGVTTDDVRAALRQRRIVAKRRGGCVVTEAAGVKGGSKNEWPISGGASSGLLECVARASCLPSLPERLAERTTTFLLTLLFVPAFKVAFSAALVKHYGDAVSFPDAAPWPDAGGDERRRRRLSSEFAASGSGGSGGATDAERPGEDRAAGFGSDADEDADVAATDRSARRRGIDGGPGDADSLPGSARSTLSAARRERRAIVSRCMDRVTVQLFGSAPVVAHAVVKRGALDALTTALMDVVDAATHRGPPLPRLPRGTLDPGAEGVRERVFARPCNDLRMCLARRGAAHRWLGLGEATTNASGEAKSTSEAFPMDAAAAAEYERGLHPSGGSAYPAPGAAFARVLTALERMQGMNPLTRKTGDHVERESSTWAHAVTAETFATTTAKAGAMCAADGLASEKGREGSGANAASRANAADIGTTAAVKDAETRMARDAFEEDDDGHEDDGARPPAERAAALEVSSLPEFPRRDVVAALLGAARATVDAAKRWTDRELAREGVDEAGGFGEGVEEKGEMRIEDGEMRMEEGGRWDSGLGNRAALETLFDDFDEDEPGVAARSAASPGGGEPRAFSLARSPVSVHLPLHRFAAVLVRAAAVAEWGGPGGDDPGGRGEEEEPREETSTSTSASGTSSSVSRFLGDPSISSALASLAEHPARANAWADQVHARLWVRNGDEVRRLALVYGSRFWAGLGRDADLATLQLALCASPDPGAVARRVLELGRCACLAPVASDTHPAFLRDPWGIGREEAEKEEASEGEEGEGGEGGSRLTASPRTASPRTASDRDAVDVFLETAEASASASARAHSRERFARLRAALRGRSCLPPRDMPRGALACARGAARTLASLARDRHLLVAPSSFASTCRRELAHALATGPRTRSDLSDALPASVAAEQADVDAALEELAVFRPSRSLDRPGTYALKPEAWAHFDAFFHRYQRADAEKALEEATEVFLERTKAGERVAWTPRALVEAPPSPPRPFEGLHRFARDAAVLAFCRDCVRAAARWEDEPDVQDAAVSAMSLIGVAAKATTDDDSRERETSDSVTSTFLEGKRSASVPRWAAPLVAGAPGGREEGDPKEEGEGGDAATPIVTFEEALARLADATRGAGGIRRGREDESRARVVVAECAAATVVALRRAGVLGEDVPESERGRARGPDATGRPLEATGRPLEATDPSLDPVFEKTVPGLGSRADVSAAADASAVSNRSPSAAATPAPGAGGSEMSDFERARAANRERQRLVMARMAEQQRAFAAAQGRDAIDSDEAESDDDESEPEELVSFGEEQTTSGGAAPPLKNKNARDDASAEKTRLRYPRRLPWEPEGTCGLCHRGAEAEPEQGPLCWLALAQRSVVGGSYVRSAASSPSSPRGEFPAAPARDAAHLGLSELRGGRSSSSSFTPRVLDPIRAHSPPVHSAEPSRARDAVVDSDAREGVHALTCGHVAHAACHDRYFRSVAGVGSEHAADDRAAAETAEARARAGLAANDFTCPTCRRLCNALAPVMPPTLAQAAFFEAGGREGASARRRFFEAGNGAGGGGGEEGFSFEEEEGGANEPERAFARGPERARAFFFGPTRAALAEGFKRVVAQVRASVTLEASDRARVDFAGAEPATAAGGTRPGEGAGEGSSDADALDQGSSDADALDRALDRVELEPAVEEVRPGRLFSDGQYVERLRGTARPEGEYSVERAAESFEPRARARRHADAYWARHADTRVWAAAFERATRVAARAGPATGTPRGSPHDDDDADVDLGRGRLSGGARPEDGANDLKTLSRVAGEWRRVAHGVRLAEATARRAYSGDGDGVPGDAGDPDRTPKPLEDVSSAARAATVGRWRALREMTRLATLGGPGDLHAAATSTDPTEPSFDVRDALISSVEAATFDRAWFEEEEEEDRARVEDEDENENENEESSRAESSDVDASLGFLASRGRAEAEARRAYWRRAAERDRIARARGVRTADGLGRAEGGGTDDGRGGLEGGDEEDIPEEDVPDAEAVVLEGGRGPGDPFRFASDSSAREGDTEASPGSGRRSPMDPVLAFANPPRLRFAFLRRDPFGFLVETLARLTAAAPGYFAGPGGVAAMETLAAPVLAWVLGAAWRDAEEEVEETERGFGAGGDSLSFSPRGSGGSARKSRDGDAPRRGDDSSDDDASDARAKKTLHLFGSLACSSAYAIDALLSLAEGAAEAPEPFGWKGPAAKLAVADACARRLFGPEATAKRVATATGSAATGSGPPEGFEPGSRDAGGSHPSRERMEVDEEEDAPRTDAAVGNARLKAGGARLCRRRRGRLAEANASFRASRFSALPSDHSEVFLALADRACGACGSAPRDPALCLACGAVTCCAGFCCRAGRHGETSRHASSCGAGSGAFLLVKSTKTLLIRGPRVCLYPSVFLDAHGEEDEFMKRGRPLRLDRRRVDALEAMWAEGAFDYDTAALRASRVGSDFY